MQKHIPASCREDQELIPGRDLRKGGNQWLRRAYDETNISRVPRESEVRKVVGQLAIILKL